MTDTQKLDTLASQTPFRELSVESQSLIERLMDQFRFSFQQLRQLIEIVRDYEMWMEHAELDSLVDLAHESCPPGKQQRDEHYRAILDNWREIRSRVNSYPPEKPSAPQKAVVVSHNKQHLGLGACPVASSRTRCCNLMTLDAVENCGYACSYCSIQSFYSGNRVTFDTGFAEKLDRLELDPDKIYHIGTGQSSDSLMWGNSHGVLDAVIRFAENNPNVILELKTKSDNVEHLLRQGFPPNIICTWSLNTQTLIDHEELGSVSLEARLKAARRIADMGRVVGFHFHPMIHYDRWRKEYAQVISQLQSRFCASEVAMISLGTLTYIKPVIRQIREKGGPSKILKMPMVEAEGKLSYPEDLKLQMFSHAYNAFQDEWKSDVFFYLCMEHHKYWKPVFGHEYADNALFETAMKQSYMTKIELRR